jgi:DNA-binding transcriptional LysR family regulator
VHITVPSLLHLPFVLPGTRLVATLPERVAHRFASTLPVKTFALPFETEPLHEILLWHKRNESDPAHAWLRDLIVRLTLDGATVGGARAGTAVTAARAAGGAAAPGPAAH